MTGVPPSVERALRLLPQDDPVRPMVELVFEAEEPAVTSAVVRKLLTEIEAERGCTRGQYRALWQAEGTSARCTETQTKRGIAMAPEVQA